MKDFLVRRTASALVLVVLVTTMSFFLTRLVPGGPITQTQSMRLTQQQVEAMRRSYGLDRPIAEQYFNWLKQVLIRGDWGTSFSFGRPAVQVFMEALPNTLVLGAAAMLIQLILGIGLGGLAALHAGKAVDTTIRSLALLIFSIPTFWLGLMAILLFHSRWRLLPAGGMASLDAESLPPAARIQDLLLHLAMPATTLGLASAAALSRYVRNNLLEVAGEGYIRTARAKGLSKMRVFWLHSLRNSLGPITQLIGLSLPALLNGVLIVEVVFSWPGIGRLIFQACVARDYPVILVSTTYGAFLVVGGSLVADLLLRWLDPRVREATEA